MKIGIYDADWQVILGGAQNYEGVVAALLARDHDVEIVHHRADIPFESYAEAFGLDLSGVGSRIVPPIESAPASGRNPLSRHFIERGYRKDVSAGYDLFINGEIFELPVYCHARRGIMLSQFPRRHRDSYRGLDLPWFDELSPPARALQRAYFAFDWRRRLGSYDRVVTNSEFGRGWMKRRWGVDAEVLYPPVKTDFARRPKENLIVCVSRISYGKMHIEMARAFRELVDAGLDGWRYAVIGSLSTIPVEVRCAEELRELARGYPIDLHINAEFGALKDLLERSSLFWHAKGAGVDAEQEPDAMEHFGIATAEAMAAGCVPLVYRGGGQPEIVDHDVSGLLWSDLDELKAQTLTLAARPERRREMAEAARIRADYFGPERFEARLYAILDRVVGQPLRPERGRAAAEAAR